MQKITFFSGNRAEFGILFPLIQSLGEKYEIDLILSGAHVLGKWNTREEVISQLQKNHVQCKLIEIELIDNKKTYIHCLGEIYEKTIDYYENEEQVDLAIVLGDRIESFAFALASFYSQVPLVHVCGGDVVNVQNYDTNVRHSISKIANYHFVTSERSRKTLLQLGEEQDRVYNIGNPSFDYERLGFLPDAEQLSVKFHISKKDKIVIFTFHPASSKTSEVNFKEFKCVLDSIVNSKVGKIIITYPNNDPGYELIVNYLEKMNENKRVLCVKSLGTYNYLSLMKNYKVIIAGNSSSGLLETTLYCVPVINIGERQTGRIRGANVKDVEVDYNEINRTINEIVENYDTIKSNNEGSKYLFGDGTAAIKAKKYVEKILETKREDRLFKKFIVR